MRPNQLRYLWSSIFFYVLLSTNLLAPSTTAISTDKFASWFPGMSRATYQSVSEKDCAGSLSEYRDSLKTPNKKDQAATCSRQQACILTGLREDIKSRMASASVLLGLTPGLLASIGPAVAETAVLSTQKPLLSMLVSLGCPAVYPSRVLAYEDAREILHIQPYQAFTSIRSSSFLSSTAFMVMEYGVLCAAAANVFYTSFELGVKTVVSFRCINYTLPLVWSVLALVIHMVTSAAFYTKLRHFWSPSNFFLAGKKKRKYSSPTSYMYLPDTQLVTSPVAYSSGNGNSNNITSDHRDSDLEERVKPSNRSIILNYIATSLAFLHVVFGSMIFSSLLFVEILDVVTVILRYMASTLVSRIVLMFELDQIRRERWGRHQQRQQGQRQRQRSQSQSQYSQVSQTDLNPDLNLVGLQRVFSGDSSGTSPKIPVIQTTIVRKPVAERTNSHCGV